MMRRPVALLGALLAVGLAVVGILVGIATLDVARDAEAQRLLAESSPGRLGATPHERGLGTRIGEALLGVADDRSYYDAVLLAKSSALPGQPDADVLELRAEAQAILTRLVRGEGDAPLQSRAGNLLGSLFFEDAKVARQNPRRYLEQAAAAFQDAVLKDPGNVEAKRNLELLSTLPLETRFRKESASGAEASASGGGETGY